jgi:hypothetical protein
MKDDPPSDMNRAGNAWLAFCMFGAVGDLLAFLGLDYLTTFPHGVCVATGIGVGLCVGIAAAQFELTRTIAAFALAGLYALAFWT